MVCSADLEPSVVSSTFMMVVVSCWRRRESLTQPKAKNIPILNLHITSIGLQYKPRNEQAVPPTQLAPTRTCTRIRSRTRNTVVEYPHIVIRNFLDGIQLQKSSYPAKSHESLWHSCAGRCALSGVQRRMEKLGTKRMRKERLPISCMLCSTRTSLEERLKSCFFPFFEYFDFFSFCDFLRFIFFN